MTMQAMRSVSGAAVGVRRCADTCRPASTLGGGIGMKRDILVGVRAIGRLGTSKAPDAPAVALERARLDGRRTLSIEVSA
jgi:hypothetical protein